MFSEIIEVYFLEDATIRHPYRGFFDETRRDRVIDPVLANTQQLRNIFD